jgi:hypothetical protein
VSPQYRHPDRTPRATSSESENSARSSLARTGGLGMRAVDGSFELCGVLLECFIKRSVERVLGEIVRDSPRFREVDS